MKPPICLLLGLFVLTLRPLCCDGEFPKDWPEATAESQGLSSSKLDSIWRELEQRRSDVFLVIRNDRLVYERYANGFSRTKPHGTASLAKSLVGSMSLMVAMNDGRIDPADVACKYVPEWAATTGKKEITIHELAAHTSGLDDAEDDDQPHDKLAGWKGDFWKKLPPPNDPFTISRDLAPLLAPPGAREYYSNCGMAMLAYCVTASLRAAPQADLRSLLKQRILDPLGIPASEWSVGYGATMKLGDLPLVPNWGGAAFSPNAAARVGRLVLHKGEWDDRQLLDASVVTQATTYSGTPNRIGLAWWVNRYPDGRRVWPAAPEDAFWGSGAGGQFLLVIRSLNLIVVRNGAAMDANPNSLESLGKYLTTPLVEAIQP